MTRRLFILFQPDQQHRNICGADTGDTARLSDGHGPDFCQLFSGFQTETADGVIVKIRGQEPVVAAFEENPWYYEVQDIGRLAAAMDYDYCYTALETTRKVVAVLEAARKDGGLSF